MAGCLSVERAPASAARNENPLASLSLLSSSQPLPRVRDVSMTLSEDIRAAASTLQEVSSGLASALRIAAKRQHATAGVVDTFREAEALTLTVSAIVDDAAPILVLLDCDATVVGRAPVVGAEKASVRNGFDSLALILLALLRKATDAGAFLQYSVSA